MSVMSNDRIQEYIDGRLSETDEAAMAAFLLANPEKAAEIQELRQQNEALKGVGAEVLSEPIPRRLKDVVSNARRREDVVRHDITRRRGVFEGVALASTLLVGILTGWFAHGFYQTPFPTASQLALQSARDAYLFYGTDKTLPSGFIADQENDLTEWLKSAFNKAIGRPSLDDLGYRYVGTRVFPWARGRMGLYLYENESGSRAALVFWPTVDPTVPATSAAPTFQDLLASVFPGDGLGYALICDKKNKDFDQISKAVASFFKPPNT